MSRLVAQKRLNKHGQLVTRWVNPDKASPVSPSAIPAPQSGAQRSRLIDRLARRIGKEGLDDGSDIPIIRDELVRLDDRSLSIIDKAVKKAPSQINALYFAITEYADQGVIEVAHFITSFSEDADTYDRVSLLNGLREYEMFAGVTDLTTLEGEDYDAATALIRVGYSVSYVKTDIDKMGGRSFKEKNLHFTDPELVTVIVNNRDRTDQIISFVEQRKTLDAEIIRDYLNQAAPLREGYL